MAPVSQLLGVFSIILQNFGTSLKFKVAKQFFSDFRFFSTFFSLN
jgi:hypothetical protein